MTPTTGPRVLVIGAGFAGVGLAARLIRAGHQVTVLEKADDLGGVWRENTYPGCACDVPSHLYSLSFAPNPDWSRRYSPQAEILAYLHEVADRFGVTPTIRFGVEVDQAVWDDDAGLWEVTDTRGGVYRAQVLVPATGQLSRPAWPAIPGLERFTGPVMHSALWRPEVELTDRRIAVIGTGASAIQFVPRLAGPAERITVFQRTPTWVLPRLDHRYSGVGRRLTRRWPGLQRRFRAGYHALTEFFGVALTRSPVRARLISAAAGAFLRLQVRDPGLRRALTPRDALGCKRVLFTSDWYPTLTRPDVELVTDPIQEVTARGIRTADGVERAADVLILGTGFTATEFLAPIRIVGQGGLELSEVWADGAHAWFGLAVPRFPNLFILYGPNTNLGSGSVLVMLEAQFEYLLLALEAVRGGERLAIRPELAAAFDLEMRTRLAGSVWAGCSSWYRTPSGRIPTNWPGLPSEYVDRLRFRRTDYH